MSWLKSIGVDSEYSINMLNKQTHSINCVSLPANGAIRVMNFRLKYTVST